MKKLSLIFAGLAVVMSLAAPLLGAAPVAASNESALCEGSGGTWKPDSDLPNGGACTSKDGQSVVEVIQLVTDVLIFIIGAVAVVMIIVGGLRYVTSSGEQAALTGAKNTIVYALVGVVIALMAYAIVRFIIGTFL